MRSKASTAVSVFQLAMMIASLAIAEEFNLNGIEISPGATTKDCTAGVDRRKWDIPLFVAKRLATVNGTWREDCK